MKSPSTQKGCRLHSVRCIEFWLNQGYDLESAKIEVTKRQSHSRSPETIKNWLKTLSSKSKDEIKRINFLKGHSVEVYIAKGYSDEEAEKLSNEYYKKRNNYSKSSQSFFILLDQCLESTNVYYKLKNYEKQFYGKCVDFYDANSETVVEYYGDFWHRNPEKYKSTFESYGKKSIDTWNEDKIRIEKIKSHPGVKSVIIVCESDVIKNPQNIVNSIIKEIKNGN